MSETDESRVVDDGSEGLEAADRSEEDRLVEAARTDRAAFGLLYDRYVDEIYHYIYRRVGDESTAEDITASVWERALGAIGRFESRGLPFGAWLYRIAGNAVANHYRRRRLRQHVPFVGQGATTDAQRQIDDRSDVRQALRELSASDQEVLSLFYYAGMTPAEIAAVQGCTTGVVHKRLHRARQRLRDRIEGDSRVSNPDA